MPGALQGPLLDWLGVAVSVCLAIAYELTARRLERSHPERFARPRHARLRAQWVEALARQPGTELLAVQTLRNSLMSVTILASTYALAFMGVISLAQRTIAPIEGSAVTFTPRLLVVVLLLCALFASHLVAAIAMRFFNHAGFMVSLPAGSPQRDAVTPQAVAYLQRAGNYYGLSIRSLFFLVPLASGLLSPRWMPLPTVAVLVALSVFDRVPGAARAAPPSA